MLRPSAVQIAAQIEKGNIELAWHLTQQANARACSESFSILMEELLNIVNQSKDKQWVDALHAKQDAGL